MYIPIQIIRKEKPLLLRNLRAPYTTREFHKYAFTGVYPLLHFSSYLNNIYHVSDRDPPSSILSLQWA